MKLLLGFRKTPTEVQACRWVTVTAKFRANQLHEWADYTYHTLTRLPETNISSVQAWCACCGLYFVEITARAKEAKRLQSNALIQGAISTQTELCKTSTK